MSNCQACLYKLRRKALSLAYVTHLCKSFIQLVTNLHPSTNPEQSFILHSRTFLEDLHAVLVCIVYSARSWSILLESYRDQDAVQVHLLASLLRGSSQDLGEAPGVVHPQDVDVIFAAERLD